MKERTDIIPFLSPTREVCEGGVAALDSEMAASLLRALGNHWTIDEHRRLFRPFGFSDFKQALEFTHRVGTLTVTPGRHPDRPLGWSKAELILWTRSINAPTHNDFIFAAKTSDGYAESRG